MGPKAYERLAWLPVAIVRLWPFQTLRLAAWLFRGVEAPCVVSRPYFGFQLMLDVSRSNLQRCLWLQGEKFLEERQLVAALVAPDMSCIIAVGANSGYYLLMLRRLTSDFCKIVCFEPEPHNLIELERNIAVNRLANVEVFHGAAGMNVGMIGLEPGINGHVTQDRGAPLRVPLVSLDAVVTEKVDLIKVDVEGYETHVLFGAERVIRESWPTLMIEVHPWLMTFEYSFSDLFAFMHSYYPLLIFYEKAEGDTLAMKAWRRYSNHGAIRRAPDVQGLIGDAESKSRTRPFWILAPGRGRAGHRERARLP